MFSRRSFNMTEKFIFKYSGVYNQAMVDIQSRLGSFMNCPNPYISHDRFALAGFYYNAIRWAPDMVTCYSCGGNFALWDVEDDPFEEHAKYAPRCAHLFLMKGWRYIHMVYNGNIMLDSPISPDPNTPGYPKCVVCLERDSTVAYFPCGHTVTCRTCATSLNDCPMCRRRITHVARLFFA